MKARRPFVAIGVPSAMLQTMGEAKHNREKLRALMLDEIAMLLSPLSEEEQTLAMELQEQEPLIIRRQQADRLAWMKMQPKDCHANVGFYVDADPNKRSRHVVGWWPQGDTFVLHSVVGVDDQLTCVTPQLTGAPDFFPFIPDPEITIIANGRFERRGMILPRLVRSTLDSITKVMVPARERLIEGMDPHRVQQLVNLELNEPS